MAAASAQASCTQAYLFQGEILMFYSNRVLGAQRQEYPPSCLVDLEPSH